MLLRFTHLLEQCKDARRDLHLNQAQTVDIISKVDILPRYALCCVHLLLQLEHVLVELLLKRFVGEVDAQLLEGVGLLVEGLEAKDVKNACRKSHMNEARRGENGLNH